MAGLLQLLIHSAPTGASAQQVALKWKYEEGSELVYRVTNRQELHLPMDLGSSVTNRTETMRWKVQSVAPDGDATITVTTEHIRVEASTPIGSNQVYDSDTDTAPFTPETRMAAAVVGLSYSMVVGADGTVRSVQGTEQLIEAMRSSFPAAGAAGPPAAFLEQMFNEEFFNSMAQERSQMFPTDPVGPNDSWEDSSSMTWDPMVGTITRQVALVLDGVEQRDGRTVALISGTGEMVFVGNPAAPLGIDVSDTETTGTMTFDVDRGVMLSSTTTGNMTMKTSVTGPSVTMTVTLVTSQELIEYIPGG